MLREDWQAGGKNRKLKSGRNAVTGPDGLSGHRPCCMFRAFRQFPLCVRGESEAIRTGRCCCAVRTRTARNCRAALLSIRNALAAGTRNRDVDRAAERAIGRAVPRLYRQLMRAGAGEDPRIDLAGIHRVHRDTIKVDLHRRHRMQIGGIGDYLEGRSHGCAALRRADSHARVGRAEGASGRSHTVA